MNNVAGINVSKGKGMVFIFCPFGDVVAKPVAVGHTGSELKERADYLKSLDGENQIVMEHIRRYYEPVARFLYKEGIFVSAVNPELVKDHGNNSLRKVKTDKTDARKIAQYGLDVCLSMMYYKKKLGKAERTCLGECQSKGRMGKLL